MIFSVLGQTALVYWLFGRKWEHLPVILLTCSLLMLFLGLNVSLKGLVFVPATSYYLIVETFSLILSLNFVFVITFIVLEIKSLKPQLALYS